jgi:hypothetical protein
MIYFKNKRDKVDKCNICGLTSTLSWDHVPPKGSINLTCVEQETIFQKLAGKQGEKRLYFESQNGVKYRTICNKCNNVLGREYDPHLNKFALEVGRLLKTHLVLPRIIHVETKINRLIRSIFGHLLASKGDYEDTVPDRLMREVVQDSIIKTPDDLQLMYWVYTYSNIIVMRDVIMPAKRGYIGGNNFATFSILKYFPVGYLVTNVSKYENLQNLTSYCTENIDKEVSIPLLLNDIRHPDWPEIVDDGNIMFVGQSLNSSVCAKPRIAKRELLHKGKNNGSNVEN